MGPRDSYTTTPTVLYGAELPDWRDIITKEGDFGGTEHDVLGGTEIYDSAGNYIRFRDNDGNEYDEHGTPIDD